MHKSQELWHYRIPVHHLTKSSSSATRLAMYSEYKTHIKTDYQKVWYNIIDSAAAQRANKTQFALS